MKQLVALGFAIGSLTVVSFQPAMVGLIIGVFAVGSVFSALTRNARKR